MQKENQFQAKKAAAMRNLFCILMAALLLPVLSLAEADHTPYEIPVTDVGPV